MYSRKVRPKGSHQFRCLSHSNQKPSHRGRRQSSSWQTCNNKSLISGLPRSDALPADGLKICRQAFPFGQHKPMKHPTTAVDVATASAIHSEIWTVQDLALFLKCSIRSVYELTRRRGQTCHAIPLPVLRLPCGMRFRKADIEQWLDRLAGLPDTK
jgi:hypothetical protein